jgi:hypothetical protein
VPGKLDGGRAHRSGRPEDEDRLSGSKVGLAQEVQSQEAPVGNGRGFLVGEVTGRVARSSSAGQHTYCGRPEAVSIEAEYLSPASIDRTSGPTESTSQPTGRILNRLGDFPSGPVPCRMDHEYLAYGDVPHSGIRTHLRQQARQTTAGSPAAAPTFAYAPTSMPFPTCDVVETSSGRKPRAIIQTASTISCTARGMKIKTCWDELAPMTPYIASRSATT